MFRFAHPHMLWLLWAIPLLVVIFLLAWRLRKRRLARFGSLTTLDELMPEVSNGRVFLKFLLFVSAIFFLILAAARPQFGSKLLEEKSEGIEMMLVVDVSNSMLAEDFAPNRLERTKYAINKLFEGMKQDRVGLVVFAGEPKVQLPITSDYRMAKAFAQKIDPTLVSVQGTAVGKALEQALLSFSGETVEEGRHSRVIILITDGDLLGKVGLALGSEKRDLSYLLEIHTDGIVDCKSLLKEELVHIFGCIIRAGILLNFLEFVIIKLVRRGGIKIRLRDIVIDILKCLHNV